MSVYCIQSVHVNVSNNPNRRPLENLKLSGKIQNLAKLFADEKGRKGKNKHIEIKVFYLIGVLRTLNIIATLFSALELN